MVQSVIINHIIKNKINLRTKNFQLEITKFVIESLLGKKVTVEVMAVAQE
jgi:hypothetical protein